jgi:hypothetical protein
MKLKRLLVGLCLLFSVAAPALPLFSQPVSAVDVLQSVCDDATAKKNRGEIDSIPEACNDRQEVLTNNKDLFFGKEGIAATGLNVFSILVGVIAVIVIIISGLRIVVSGGDSNTVSASRKALIYAVVGLAIAAISQGVVMFILDRL